MGLGGRLTQCDAVGCVDMLFHGLGVSADAIDFNTVDPSVLANASSASREASIASKSAADAARGDADAIASEASVADAVIDSAADLDMSSTSFDSGYVPSESTACGLFTMLQTFDAVGVTAADVSGVTPVKAHVARKKPDPVPEGLFPGQVVFFWEWRIVRWLSYRAGVVSNAKRFGHLCMACIFINTVALMIDSPFLDENIKGGIGYLNYALTLVFTLEFVFKIMHLGVSKYCADGFNVFDAVIVLFSCSDIIITLMVAAADTSGESGRAKPSTFGALRAVRIMRLFRYVTPTE